MKREILFLGLFVLLLSNGCASRRDCVEILDTSNPEHDGKEVCEVFDPIEPVNRVIYRFNDFFYLHILDPIDKVYVKFPELFRRGVRNFFHNLSSPVRFAGAVTQGESDAGYVAGEPVVNTLLGFGGIVNWTNHQYPDEEDIGQSLAFWGIEEGFYLVVPFCGPSTLRDLIGDIFAFPLNPVSQMGITESMAYVSAETVDAWNKRSDKYFFIRDKGIEPYMNFRRDYIDNRRKNISK